MPCVPESARPRRDQHRCAQRVASGRGERIGQAGQLGAEHAQDRGVVLRRRGSVLGHAGCMHERGEGPQLGPGCVERGPGGRSHVPCDVHGPAAGRPDRGERRFHLRVGRPAPHQRERASRARQRGGEAGADAARASGDQHDVVRSERQGLARWRRLQVGLVPAACGQPDLGGGVAGAQLRDQALGHGFGSVAGVQIDRLDQLLGAFPRERLRVAGQRGAEERPGRGPELSVLSSCHHESSCVGPRQSLRPEERIP